MISASYRCTWKRCSKSRREKSEERNLEKQIIRSWCFASVQQQQKLKLNISDSSSDFLCYLMLKLNSVIKEKHVFFFLTVCPLCCHFNLVINQNKPHVSMSPCGRAFDTRLNNPKLTCLIISDSSRVMHHYGIAAGLESTREMKCCFLYLNE